MLDANPSFPRTAQGGRLLVTLCAGPDPVGLCFSSAHSRRIGRAEGLPQRGGRGRGLARLRARRCPRPSMTSAPRTVPGPRWRWRKQSLPEIRSARCRVGGFMSREHLSRECGDALSKPEVSQGVRPRALVPLLGRAIRT